MPSGISKLNVPFVTADQMREVDRVMEQQYGILLVQMMENAGRNLAHLARSRFLSGDPRKRQVLVLAGTGGNGGGGLVCARHLHNWGAKVQIITTAPPSVFHGVPSEQLGIVQRLDISVSHGLGGIEVPAADLIVDAIIGYSLKGPPKGAAAELIRVANDHASPILSLDVPSGVDATTGAVQQLAIMATATLSLALPKTGLRTPTAMPHVGELYLADIGVPPELYARPEISLSVGPVFAMEDLVRLL